MVDENPNVAQASGDDVVPDALSNSMYSGESSSGSAFHSQLEYLAQHQFNPAQHHGLAYGQQAFDMNAMTAALPQPGMPHTSARSPHAPTDAPTVLSPVAVYQMQQASQYPTNRPQQYDPMGASRVQQPQPPPQPQHYMGSPYGTFPQHSNMHARQPVSFPAQGQYGHVDPYSFSYNPIHAVPVDPRFASHPSYAMPYQGDSTNFLRRASEPSVVPSFPRGPPRKPKQSGHALWVGNLPPAATVTDLKDHFSRDATTDIESLFLISKSNCAFVNYRSEAACVAAMNRFHDSRFHGVRLVCRLRRGPTNVSNSLSSTPVDALEPSSSGDIPAGSPSPAPVEEEEEDSGPTIVGGSTTLPATSPGTGDESPSRTAEKYFIVKSLTVQDLEASVRNGIWATQSHNEAVLNKAFDETDDVYLIFSANKSGEYFGYARMASRISGNPVSLGSSSAQDEARSPGAPQSIPTPATATAPKGRIIDDSARGTIFWEAEHSDAEDEESPARDSSESGTGQSWGRQFAIEWQSTTRLPFYRTRGLRNPWNANREVKIARDGTELEPSVGRRLVQMFHRPSPGPSVPQLGLPMR